jgi:oxygen-independent coproporphyrinogen-3 oxidase
MVASLYFHVPFCKSKCPYCHFYIVKTNQTLVKQYATALLKELCQKTHLLQGMVIQSIYFGGGTPTQMDPDFFDKVLTKIRSHCTLANDCEVTLEANPEDMDRATARAFFQMGINRISFGIQSFDPDLLHILGRNTTPKGGIQAIETARSEGVENLSIDLMYEVPKQKTYHFKKSLSIATSLPITHLSIYNLTFEPKTLYKRQEMTLRPLLPSERETLEMMDALNVLTQSQFIRYEISAFCKKGFESKHNLGYWKARPFLGFGPSAFSYWQQMRFENSRSITQYCRLVEQNKSAMEFCELLEHPQRIKELLAIHLRTLEGVDIELFEKRHGQLPQETKKMIVEWIQKKFLKAGNQLKLTAKGIRFYDSIAQSLI